MTTIANTFASKLAVAFVAIAMMFSLVAPAQAQTAEELQAQIDTLMATITALQAQLGGTTAPAVSADAYVFTRSLSDGSEGADVTALQTYLIGAGFSIPAGATGYYGSQTTAAVAAWQAANGVAPAVGFFGPISQAKYNMLMAAMDDSMDDSDDSDDSTDDSDDSDDNSSLGNNEGSIEDVDEVSADESVLDEGQEGGVLAFTVEIDGDVEINRMDVFAEVVDSTTASDDADDYFTEASLWVDGDKVATIDVDDFDNDDYTGNVTNGATTDDEYRLRFSGLDLVFSDGDEPEFQVAFEVLGSLDSLDLAGDWTVALESIRYIDGEGFTDSDTTVVEETFGFDAEETAELDITKSSDSPDATTVEVDTDDESEEIEIFIFEIEEENGVDLTIEDIDMTASTTNIDVTTTIDEVLLYVDGEEVGSESPNSVGVLSFENLGIEVDADDTIDVTAKVVFKGTDDFAEGDSVFLTFNAVSDAEDANGNDEGDISGSNPTDFSSDTFSLRSEGIGLVLSSMDEDETEAAFSGDTDTGTFTFEIDVTAFGEDFYMDEDSANVDFDLLVDGVAVAAASSTATLDISGADDGAVADFKISKGDDVTLTLTVETDSTVSGSAKVRVNSVAYSAADDATEELTEAATPANDWTTDSLILN